MHEKIGSQTWNITVDLLWKKIQNGAELEELMGGTSFHNCPDKLCENAFSNMAYKLWRYGVCELLL